MNRSEPKLPSHSHPLSSILTGSLVRGGPPKPQMTGSNVQGGAGTFPVQEPGAGKARLRGLHSQVTKVQTEEKDKGKRSTEPLLPPKGPLCTCEKHTPLGRAIPHQSTGLGRWWTGQVLATTCPGCLCAVNHWNNCDSPAPGEQQQEVTERKKKGHHSHSRPITTTTYPLPTEPPQSPTQKGQHISATVTPTPPFHLNCLFTSHPSLKAFSGSPLPGSLL